ncbi:MAG: hypothetical protein ACOYLO_12765 [Ferruginibacter sp.]
MKFLSDANAILYVDGVRKGEMMQDVPLRIDLPKGNYLLKAISKKNEEVYIELEYRVSETGSEYIKKIKLDSLLRLELEMINVQGSTLNMASDKNHEGWIQVISATKAFASNC